MDTIIHLNNKSYCAFCGNEITSVEYGQTLCQCPDAQEYRKALHLKLQLEFEASKIMADAPKPKYGLCTIIAPLQDFVASQANDSGFVPSNPM